MSYIAKYYFLTHLHSSIKLSVIKRPVYIKKKNEGIQSDPPTEKGSPSLSYNSSGMLNVSLSRCICKLACFSPLIDRLKIGLDLIINVLSALSLKSPFFMPLLNAPKNFPYLCGPPEDHFRRSSEMSETASLNFGLSRCWGTSSILWGVVTSCWKEFKTTYRSQCMLCLCKKQHRSRMEMG